MVAQYEKKLRTDEDAVLLNSRIVSTKAFIDRIRQAAVEDGLNIEELVSKAVSEYLDRRNAVLTVFLTPDYQSIQVSPKISDSIVHVADEKAEEIGEPVTFERAKRKFLRDLQDDIQRIVEDAISDFEPEEDYFPED